MTDAKALFGSQPTKIDSKYCLSSGLSMEYINDTTTQFAFDVDFSVFLDRKHMTPSITKSSYYSLKEKKQLHNMNGLLGPIVEPHLKIILWSKQCATPIYIILTKKFFFVVDILGN